MVQRALARTRGRRMRANTYNANNHINNNIIITITITIIIIIIITIITSIIIARTSGRRMKDASLDLR